MQALLMLMLQTLPTQLQDMPLASPRQRGADRPVVRFVTIGDSKTLGQSCCMATNGFQNELVQNLAVKGITATREMYALGGYGTAAMLPGLPAFIASVTPPPSWVLINLGTNDLGATTQAQWLIDMGSMLDQIHAAWPRAQVRLMRVSRWANPHATVDAFDAWIDLVVATRSSFAGLGPDERTFLMANTDDQIHPNVAGYHITAGLWQAVMGY